LSAQPIKIAILAMGGEGGGVLADWIVDLGESNDHFAQTTSVPGVAQRTGATIYYVELYPRRQAEIDGGVPVLALMPLPGDVDVVLASELMECGRAVQRGLVTPDRTTLVASTHRVYSIAEKTALGDGRVDGDALLAHAAAAAKRFVHFDMAEAAERTGSVLSAVLFGALAGTGVLPFSREQFEATITRGGVGVAPSLRAFALAFDEAGGDVRVRGDAGAAPTDDRVQTVAEPAAAALDGGTDAPDGAADGSVRGSVGGRDASDAGALRVASSASPASDASTATPRPVDARVRALLGRLESEIPPASHGVVREGLRRLVDYQDPAYAGLYLDRLAPLVAPSTAAPALLCETARHLALWMSYEDTMRVAQLKTRGSRFERVRSEVRSGAGQVLAIDEYLHPRVQEIAETLPGWLGRRIERPGALRRLVERFTRKGRVVTTSSLGGFLMLWTSPA